MVSLEESISLDKRKNHNVEVVVDRLLIKEMYAGVWNFHPCRRGSHRVW